MKASSKLVAAIKDNAAEIKQLAGEKQDWSLALNRVDALFKRMSDPKDAIWKEATFNKLKEVYFSQRDKAMSNITLRTVEGMPEKFRNDTKIIFLQVAEVCSYFNASHKVNFEADELPVNFKEIAMMSKGKGIFTYEKPTPYLYKKTSLTFDYWMPKFIEWAQEIRDKKLKDWKGAAILLHESCTDFMRTCLLFLSDNKINPPIAKAEDREALLKLFDEEFIWIKKSAKREDIPGNNKKLVAALTELNKQTGIAIPLEAWGRIQQSAFIKALLK